MRTRGKWFNKQIWFSFCSVHFHYQEQCNMCNAGIWRNYLGYKIDNLMYRIFPKIWHKLNNK